MDKERIDGFRSAFAPGETLFWQVPAAARERMAFYSENLPRLFSEKITAVFAVSDHYALEFMRFLQGQGIRRPEALRDGTPLRCRHCSAGGAGGTGKHKEAAMSDFMRTLCKIAIPVCLQKEAERPLTVEIWTRWAGVLCLFSEYNGEPDLLFRLAQVKSAAIGDGHAQLIERTGGKFRYSLAVLVCDRPQCRIDLC